MNENNSRLPLVEGISAIFDKLPPINLFKAAANATTLYPAFIPYMYQLFKPMALCPVTERLVVLYVAKLSDCKYIWRQNVVVARTLGISQEQIDALDREDVWADCFTPQQRSAFAFTKDVINSIEASDSVYAETSRYFSSQAVTEMVFVIGTYMLLARLARTGRVPLDAEPADAAKWT